MIIIYKERGILIPVYFIFSVLGSLILSKILEEYVGGIFAQNYDNQIILGIGIFIAGLWAHYTCDDFIIVNGEKEEMYLNHHFFFISMKIWSYIFIVGGLLTIISGIFETIN